MFTFGIIASSFVDAVGANPEAGLTLSRTDSVGTLSAMPVSERNDDIVMACDIRFPTSTPTTPAVLWEQGGTGAGAFIGFSNATGSITFRCRGGDGSVNLSGGSTTNGVVVDTIDYPTDGEVHTVVWEYRPSAAGRVRLWIDGVLKGSSETTGGGQLRNGIFAGAASGGYTVYQGTVPVGESTNAWSTVASLTDASGLRIYLGQLSTIETPLAGGYGTTGIDLPATYSPGYWGYVDSLSLGTLSLTSGSYVDAFGTGATAIPLFANFQQGTITGDTTKYFRMYVNGVNNPTTWDYLTATVDGETTTFTRASATIVSSTSPTIYEWSTSGEPFSTESSGTTFTWGIF